jgi:hypothetical protein
MKKATATFRLLQTSCEPVFRRVAVSCSLALFCALVNSANGAAGVLAQPPTAAQFGESLVIDGLAAVLGGADPLDTPRAILQSDVELRARLALLGRDPERGMHAPLPHSLLRATLDELIGEQLIAVEAERVQIPAPRADDVGHELSVIERDAGGASVIAELLSRTDAARADLEAMALRRAMVGAFLRANLEGVTVVTEAEVDERLRAEPERFVGEQALSVRAAVRAVLAREALTRNIGHWVRVLRARTRVRVFAVYGES